MQLQALACHNDVIRRFRGNIEDCCKQHFQSQCFTYNWGDDCKAMALDNFTCDQVVPIEPECANILPKCPSFSVKSLRQSFFTSALFFGSMAVLGILVIFVYLIFLQCNKPDTSYDIDHEDKRSNRKTNGKRDKGRDRKKSKTKRKIKS